MRIEAAGTLGEGEQLRGRARFSGQGTGAFQHSLGRERTQEDYEPLWNAENSALQRAILHMDSSSHLCFLVTILSIRFFFFI